jgi:hypothetical protein
MPLGVFSGDDGVNRAVGEYRLANETDTLDHNLTGRLAFFLCVELTPSRDTAFRRRRPL